MNLTEQIAAIVAAQDFGTATATKRGRNPEWPYVPVVQRTHGFARERTAQVLGKAFKTREEAVAHAQAVIDYRGAKLAAELAQPKYRALREAHGLPREIICAD